MGLTADVFSLFGRGMSWRDLILIAGGVFLIYKAVGELHQKLEGDADVKGAVVKASFAAVLVADRGARRRLCARLRHHRDRYGVRHQDHGGLRSCCRSS